MNGGHSAQLPSLHVLAHASDTKAVEVKTRAAHEQPFPKRFRRVHLTATLARQRPKVCLFVESYRPTSDYAKNTLTLFVHDDFYDATAVSSTGDLIADASCRKLP